MLKTKLVNNYNNEIIIIKINSNHHNLHSTFQGAKAVHTEHIIHSHWSDGSVAASL